MTPQNRPLDLLKTHYTLVSVVTDDSGGAPRVSGNARVRALRLGSGSVR
jgi:hypothetical protein